MPAGLVPPIPLSFPALLCRTTCFNTSSPSPVAALVVVVVGLAECSAAYSRHNILAVSLGVSAPSNHIFPLFGVVWFDLTAVSRVGCHVAHTYLSPTHQLIHSRIYPSKFTVPVSTGVVNAFFLISLAFVLADALLVKSWFREFEHGWKKYTMAHLRASRIETQTTVPRTRALEAVSARRNAPDTRPILSLTPLHRPD
jgi:hypothetical protein